MQIYGPAHLHGPQAISAPHTAKHAAPSSGVSRGVDTTDTLELSPEALFADQVRELPDVRMDRVNEIRAQLEAGVYETDDKLDLALERLLDELA